MQKFEKNGKLPADKAEEISRNKLCVDLIGTYSIPIKGNNRYLN